MTPPDFGKQKVLIVDDEPQNIKILGQALKQFYEIYVATDGETALQRVKDQHPDLILLDIMMPGKSGYDVLKELKSTSQTAAIPVIFITARDSEADETRGLEIGAVDYITKPFSLPIVKARVKTHLELKRSRDILAHYALYDGLTGVLTRRRFDELLVSEWNRCLRHKLPISLIMLDIDDFKLYNDNYGHPAGDVCLKLVAQAVSGTLKRASDFLARYGGEEFVALLAGSDAFGAERVAQKMLAAVAALNIPHAHSRAVNRVTVSLGIATMFPQKDVTADELVKAADRLLYQAKSEGRNRYKTQEATS